MPNMPEVPTLGPLEEQVTHILWGRGELTIREIISFLPAELAYTTIATVLKHLGEKGMVRVIKDGRTSKHAVRMSREEYTAAIMDQALDASQNRTATILHFVDAMGESDRALLRAYLEDQDKQP